MGESHEAGDCQNTGPSHAAQRVMPPETGAFPDISKCGKCSGIFRRRDYSILCVDCGYWFHHNCVNMTVKEINSWKKRQWHCGCERQDPLTTQMTPGFGTRSVLLEGVSTDRFVPVHYNMSTIASGHGRARNADILDVSTSPVPETEMWTETRRYEALRLQMEIPAFPNHLESSTFPKTIR